MRPRCEHTDKYTWMLTDARGIPCGTVCDDCAEETEKSYRPDVMTNPNYEADEAIESDDY